MSNSFSGVIAEIQPTIEVGAKKFKKRQIVIVEDPTAQYLNEVPFMLNGEKVGLGDQFKVGDKVQVDYFLNGRRWKNPQTGKTSFFLEAKIYKMNLEAAAAAAPVADAPAQDEAAADSENLPF